ncbi:helix-turn-helix domain-containing protein [Limimaricola pyoseonensis]|uniref:HTH DNA binding domain-containing protein n=1 Tax=Limimaricola pyoseonensis TaxID=521013 RepID=A0A1G7D9X0_9RHOB|nr:helix-turn-helix domain-containing protein [Limimaricola pyoseonensis]SDE47706.1 HTH DNA binding domain-containing protein [Limimaricola pyoseonensis]
MARKAERGIGALDMLRVEVLAARIEAFARADPDAGNLWRSELAVAEAVASAAMEDLRLSETDLLPRVAGAGRAGADPVAGELALAVIRAMKAPGDPIADTGPALLRYAAAAGMAGLPAEGMSGLFDDLRDDDPPILSAARVAARFAQATERRAPIAERLLFMGVEGALRGASARRSGAARIEDDPLRGLSGRVDADWVALPALALTDGGFRPWSPGSAAGLADLFFGLERVLAAEIGRIGRARDWLRRARQVGEGRHGRSRLGDAAQVFAEAPCLSAPLLAERLAITPRGAINLIGALSEQGLLREITRRRSARIWAVPGLAERLAARPKPGARPPQPPRREDPAAMSRAFADLDAALGRAASVLGRHRGG